MTSKTRLVAAALAAALAATASGCGDDQAPTRARDGRVDIVLDDFLLDPQQVLAGPGELELRVRNRGRLGHSLRVRRGEKDVAVIPTVIPGGTGQGSARLSEGSYELYCVLSNHEQLGMFGTLVVR